MTDQTISVAVASLVSAALAAYVAHQLSRHRNREDELQRIRLQAYVDYVGASMRMALARRQKNEEAYLKELPTYNDAKARICFCAPEPVLRSMIHFHSQGIDLEEQQRVLAMKHLGLSIRLSLVPRPGGLRAVRNWLAVRGIGKWKMDQEAAYHLNTAQVLFDLEPGKLPNGYSPDLFPQSEDS